MSSKPIESNLENASLQDLRDAIPPGSKETQLRCLAIILLGTGSSRDQVMLACGVTERALRKWISAFNENGIEGEPRPRLKWAPSGTRPTVVRNGDHIRLSVLGMVCPRTGELFTIEASHTDSEVFQAFLDESIKFVIPKRKRNLLIMDNATWHRVKKINWHFFEPVYLPPYSPDLNPIELIWLLPKTKWFSNLHCRTKEDLSKRICKALVELMNDPQQVSKTATIHF